FNMMLQFGQDVNSKNRINKTCLQLAVYYDHPELTKLLLERGAEVDYRGNKDETCLMQAILDGYFNIAKLLIDHGADIFARSRFYNLSCLELASSRGEHDIVELLLERGGDGAFSKEDLRSSLILA